MRIAVIVLAAGRSRRFGPADKLLADLDGAPVLVHTVRAVATAGFDTLVVVTGEARAQIGDFLADFAVRLVPCPQDRYGMGYSIAAGVRALDAEISGALILPGDMPLITPQAIADLVGVFRAHAGLRIVHAADSAGAQRNPVIWPQPFFADLARLEGPSGGKSLLAAASAAAVAVPVRDETNLFDIDDMAALDEARAILRSRSAHS